MVLKLKHALEPLGELIKTRLPVSHPEFINSVHLGWGLKIYIYSKFSDAVVAVGPRCIGRTTGLEQLI